ncbi:hypothetical protein SAMN04488065_1082 [Haloplanus vescus]|uniref:DUF7527 domain-containing protein n=1 Tax=Haloplanus vescus TaxID=555874 RepID=A0A1H3WRG5_9EURY|nr:hypothetical protein [Haloplanus vescus]SDZ89719.1 hypothetical protein SAMN04488065_1082 [Haloplanus vescus]
MDAEILDVVTEWETRSVGDGVGGLYELADGEFSGAVTDDATWAFVLNGRFVGVFDGDVHDFEDASLTAYVAPDVSLPLLYAMQAGDTEVRGQYYSNDTPLTDIHDTLSAGSFVGYVELSENVLSGDYYVVYYGERSLPVAYVGNSRRLVTGDEAFDLAADEVGIYSVVDASIEVVDLPERPDDATEPVGGAVAASADDSDDPSDDEDVTVASSAVSETAEDETPESSSEDQPAESSSEDAPSTADAQSDTASEFEALGAMSGVEAESAPTEDESAEDEAVDADASVDDMTDDASVESVETDEGEAETVDTEPTPDVAFGASETSDESATDEADAADAETEAETTETEETVTETADDAELQRLRDELDAARDAKADLEAERDRLAGERDELRAEVDRLQARVTELEAEIERLETDEEPARTLDSAEALAGTNLFVRYEDRADGTLEDAVSGSLAPDDLRQNLRLDYHTEFETESAHVDDQPFETFLRATPEHRFTQWLLLSLASEIRRADARTELTKLYDAIEDVDRIDFHGTVDVTPDDAEESEAAPTETFDVVFRDKMGNSVFVAAFDDSRDPTRASPIQSLVENAKPVSDALPSFAAAFAVTTSFFEADAMEAAVDATRGGLFSRSSRRSYVKRSRKTGFHLCLVEARDGDFFLTVPEL